ncbi:aminoglycoside phosphotransferase family protein [Novilysobacter antarcticus]|uniref:aminoglycoside phosphotransferase family protein n=1 Tax=Novilysobacter antarcticus TaxID=2862543 RepID=UPI001C991458|nr:phosphotransferase [Lysobacter antarcticus]
MNQVVAESNERADARLAWARQASGNPALMLVRASMDAGFRSYWRSAGHVGKPWIVMDSPPDKEDVGPWLRVRDHLERHGVRVPRVAAQDEHTGFVLMEDLGGPTYLQVITADNADALFDAAIGELLKLQALPCPVDLHAYDDELLARELALFADWFLDRHLGIQLSAAERAALAGANRFLVDAALAQPQVFVHRDFMPRNLMPVDAGPAVLDFQDAVQGPIAYDPISLFKDAFVSWPEAKVTEWLGRYHARALAAGLPVPALDRFRRDADLIGVQRHLKILGIFARLWHRDRKPRYLADAPRFIAYLDTVLPRYPELTELGVIIDRHVKPAMAARPFQPPA